MSGFFWRATSRPGRYTGDSPTALGATTGSTHLQVMATVATLFECVDMARLITIRDRLSVDSTSGVLADIPPQAAFREYVR